MAASTSPCLVRGTIHHGCLFDGVGGGLHVYYIYMVLHLPEDDGNSANTYFYLNSVQNLLTQVPSSIQKPHATWIFQGHMQGQLSTITVTPEEDLARQLDLAVRGSWGLGVGSVCDIAVVEFCLLLWLYQRVRS